MSYTCLLFSVVNEPPNSTEGNQLNVLSLAELYNSSFFHLLNSFLESAFGNSHYPCTTPPLFKIFMENFNKESVKIMTIICLITNSVFSVTKVPATHSLSLSYPHTFQVRKLRFREVKCPAYLVTTLGLNQVFCLQIL